MRTAIASKEAVFAAADELAASGAAATVEKVRDRIGGGSYSTINSLLAAWSTERRTESARAADLPPEIAALARDLALKAATEIYARVSETATAEVEAAKREGANKGAAADARVAEALTEVARLEAAAEANDRTLTELRAAMSNAEIRVSAAEGQVAAHRDEIERMREALSEAQAAQRLAEGAAAEARGQIAAMRVQVGDLTDRLSAVGAVRVN